MLEVTIGWPEIKGFIDGGLPFRFVTANGAHRIYTFDDSGQLVWICVLPTDAGAPATEFVNNYSTLPPLPIIHDTRTQFERSDVDLKIARGMCPIDAETGIATIRIKTPGVFGSGDGRFVEGGYLQLSSFDEDDYVQAFVEDTERKIAWTLALYMDPNATEPLPDEVIAAFGVLPQPIGVALPLYPIVKSYSDLELDAVGLSDTHQGQSGWFFWPMPMGNNIPPMSETEVETFGFWGFVPAEMYAKLVITRPVMKSGKARLSLNWARRE